MIWPFKKREPVEKRASASGFTAEIIAARESYISGRTGIGELTATVQSCVSMWENGLSMADVEGTALLTPSVLALMARSLALRGEALFLIDDTKLIPCADWDLSTRDGEPRAYRFSISEAGGGRSRTALAPEMLHIRIGADMVAPYYGQAPLRRANLTAGLLNAIETALSEIYENAPMGSQIVPMPEAPEVDNEALARGFNAKRGRILLRESVAVTAGGGPAPQTDWRPSDITPDLSRAMAPETLSAARDSILAAFGVLPGLYNHNTTGPMVRECQRHLAQWQLQPICGLVAQEASSKLGETVSLDVMRPLQAFDAGGRARALVGIVQAFAAAKEANIDAAQLGEAMRLVDWK